MAATQELCQVHIFRLALAPVPLNDLGAARQCGQPDHKPKGRALTMVPPAPANTEVIGLQTHTHREAPYTHTEKADSKKAGIARHKEHRIYIHVHDTSIIYVWNGRGTGQSKDYSRVRKTVA